MFPFLLPFAFLPFVVHVSVLSVCVSLGELSDDCFAVTCSFSCVSQSVKCQLSLKNDT